MVKKGLNREQMLLKEYEIVKSVALDERNQSWTRFQASLLINTIFASLVTAASVFLLARGSEHILCIVLIPVSIVGIAFSLGWIFMQKRGSAVYAFWLARLRSIERQSKVLKSFRYIRAWGFELKEKAIKELKLTNSELKILNEGGLPERKGRGYTAVKGEELKRTKKPRLRTLHGFLMWLFLGIWVCVFVVSFYFLCVEVGIHQYLLERLF